MLGIHHILVIGIFIAPNIKTEAEKQLSLIIPSGTSILIILIVTTFFRSVHLSYTLTIITLIIWNTLIYFDHSVSTDKYSGHPSVL